MSSNLSPGSGHPVDLNDGWKVFSSEARAAAAAAVQVNKAEEMNKWPEASSCSLSPNYKKMQLPYFFFLYFSLSFFSCFLSFCGTMDFLRLRKKLSSG